VRKFRPLKEIINFRQIKIKLAPNMKNQARLFEKGKWVDATELAENLDNYVADVADMNYSKTEGDKKIFVQNRNFSKLFQ